MRNSKKMTTRLVLVALLLMITLGYAFLTANLNINGTSKIKDARWNIHFANLAVTEGSVTLGEGDTAAVITENNTTEVTYAVTLTKPGDFYEFTVDAVNEGTIDGMVNLVTSTMKEGTGEAVNITDSNLPPYLSYSATYSDGKKIEKNHSLKSGKSEKYKVRIEFKKDITATQLPGAEKSFIFNFQVDYVQADNNAVDVQHAMYVYTKNVYDSNIEGRNKVYLNQPFPSTINKFNSGSETGKNIYLKHKIENNNVTESYVEFVITDALKQQLKTARCTDDRYPDAAEKTACEAKYDALVNGEYALRGLDTYDSETGLCKPEYKDAEENCVSPYYQINVNKMKVAFGTLATDENVCSYSSSNSCCHLAGLYVSVYSHFVSVNAYSRYCIVDYDGYSYCNE